MTNNYERLGWQYKNKGEYEKAIKAFDKAIAHHQKTYFALHGKGECLLSLGDYNAALDCFRKAIHMDRHHPWAFHGAGRAYYFLKQYDTALANFNTSINLNKDTKIAWLWKGRTLIKLGKYEDAENALRYALTYAVRHNASMNRISKIEQELKQAQELKANSGTSTPVPSIQINNTTNYNGGIHADNGAIVNRANVDGIHADGNGIIHRPILDGTDSETYDNQSSVLSAPLTMKNENQEQSRPVRKIRKGLFSYECSNCGCSVKKDDLFCQNCGRKFQ